MPKARKDNKGKALNKGESQRSEDNRYVYAYTDPNGKRIRLYAKSLSELRKKEDELKHNQLDGLDIYAAGESTLNFVFDRYIGTKLELRPTTYANYTYMYDHFVRDSFGKKKIRDIKYSDVIYFYYHLLNECGLQINTLETIHTILHPTFQLAVRDNIIRSNPSDGVMKEVKKKPGKNHGVRHALTLQQQRAFLGYMDQNEVFARWKPLFTVLIGTGCRIGEIIGLRWSDVDMQNEMISINHAVTYYPRKTGSYKCEFMVSLPKTEAGNRIVPMFPEVKKAFEDEHSYQEEHGFNCTEISGMTGFIFSNRFGNVHNPQAVNRAIKRITESYNAEEILKAKKEKRQPVILPHFSCHHLRHTFCSRLCEYETNVKVIQSVMGHANIETTLDIYAEVNDEKKKESFKNISKKIDLF